ncbi:outer membrane protein, OMP85-like family protein [Leptospira vanthielii serovar Holland str. Waz Holland = ATCC 700522]|uniref:Outer membrane protein, OMP85-like family protein n=1 Tax=Leptospira vanthielii serovar Holland str. Waz Holland = ATCC 700522 TaxID=1218591 RepID=N1W2W2_9LEPT|nr:outer membrane protein, OMP85-like family protein [Leptospira vanthielii serovar Holland str. Waz Holland = ATCC 700522]
MGSFSLWDQFLQLSIVPFYDVGRVWDKLRDVNALGYKHARGVGLRLVWDQATVILLDYAYSKEDQLFYLDMGHTF